MRKYHEMLTKEEVDDGVECVVDRGRLWRRVRRWLR